MILAERLCLFGFDPRSGRERDAPEADALAASVAGLMLADLLHIGRFTATPYGIRQHDSLPLSHPLLHDAAARLSATGWMPLSSAKHVLQAAAPRWWRHLHGTLAARDLLEMRVPFPFIRRYRLRSRQAWNESVALLDPPCASNRIDAIALALAAQRCGWLADLVDAERARQCLVDAGTAASRDHASALIIDTLTSS
jgi:hypothetical protein